MSLFTHRRLVASRNVLRRRHTGAWQNRRGNRRLFLESLEGRLLLAADGRVVGAVYEDLDSNGVRGPGEDGLQGWTVYVDLDQSGTHNNDAAGTPEPSATTNQDGDYVIGSLPPGTYRVSEVVPAGWLPTAPLSQDVVVVSDKDTRADFFNFGGGGILGTVWNDLDLDGVRDTDPLTGSFTDPGLNGWTVFLDLNTDGVLDPSEPSTRTDTDGHYTFAGLPPGDYEVTEVLPADWDVTEGFDSKQTATVFALQQTTQDFANFSTVSGSLRGSVWNDVNIDGIRNTHPDTGEFVEPGLDDWTVYLDLDGSGTLNTDATGAWEPSATTDEAGNYTFLSLPQGDYELTQVLPDGWHVSPEFDSLQTVTVEPGKDTVAADFANFTVLDGSLRGVVWNDVNRNSVRDTSLSGAFVEPGLGGWSLFLDLNRNDVMDAGEPAALTGADGTYVFAGLQVGEYEVREVLPTGWEVTPGFSDNVTVVVYSGVESLVPDFANFNLATAMPGSVSGAVWNDLNGNGVRDVDPVEGSFTDPGLAGWTVFADLNSNGSPDTGEPVATSGTDGGYALEGILPGTVRIVEVARPGWRATAPISRVHSLALKNGGSIAGVNFGNAELKDSAIRGVVYVDRDKDGVRGAAEVGLAGLTVFLDLDNNAVLDASEPFTTTSSDRFYTPDVNEAGAYAFSHLATGTYTVRVILPATLSATPPGESAHVVTLVAAEERSGVDTGARYRPSEIHGVRFDDVDANHQRDPGEPGVGGIMVFVDLDRDNVLDDGEPRTVTAPDGSYSFADLEPGAYVVREVESPEYEPTYPTTTGGTLWPSGVSNSAVGIVSPNSITASLLTGESLLQTVSLTLPNTGAFTNRVDVFLLFDDTGSFVNNSPIVRAAFPAIISQLQDSLSGIDLGFGVGRFEEYGNFGYEYGTGRPFVLNQPIVAASTVDYLTAIQAALNRTTPGYGGDQPETDIEALYQVVTGVGFDGNNNGSVLDSGPAGLAATQLSPGTSGDVPSFASFVADPAHFVMTPAGSIGGAGFRAGALPIILTATDTGFAYQPKGETMITGVGGVALPVSDLTGTSRPTTPYGAGAGIQQTITALNALGALVIGLGTNSQANVDPRQGLEALSKLTGAVNHSTMTIANGTADPIAPGDPLYFQIASGFATSVAGGIVSAIQNAVTNVAVNVTVQASDPRVRLVNRTGVVTGIGSGQTATFDIEFVGDGIPHRFDLQFVREGTNVVLGSIPVVLGTPIPGDGYEFEDLEQGEICDSIDFGSHYTGVTNPNVAPSFVQGGDQVVDEDASLQTVHWATAISPGPADEAGQQVAFLTTNDNPLLFSVQPTIAPDGTLVYAPAPDAFGMATVTVLLRDDGGTANGGVDTSAPETFTITVNAINDVPVAYDNSYSTDEDMPLAVPAAGILVNDTDVDSSALTAVLVSGPAHGTLTWHADGSFSYTPDANYYGKDHWTYLAHDGAANSLPATVLIDVNPVNDEPAARDDVFKTNVNTPLTVAAAGVLVNDTDIESDPLTAVLVAPPVNGTLAFNKDGSFTYTPGPGFSGTDAFRYVASDGDKNSSEATVAISVIPVVGPTKFLVVDSSSRKVHQYDEAGNALANEKLYKENKQPRGIATTKSGDTTWVVDEKGVVFVYDHAGHISGSWEAKGAGRPEGIATDGQNLWIVDADHDMVLHYANAASRRSGRAVATSYFRLARENSAPMDITTDGQHLWVVNDAPKVDKVFRYSILGKPEGNWRIDPANSQPTGLTIDPNEVQHLWIVDARTDAVYRYTDGATRLYGEQAADAVFALAAGNRHPQGIADPKPASPAAIGLPPRELLNQPAATPVGPNRTSGDGNRAARSSVDVHRTNTERIGAAVSTRSNLDRHDRALSEWIEDSGRSGALVNDLADTLDCLARSQVHLSSRSRP